MDEVQTTDNLAEVPESPEISEERKSEISALMGTEEEAGKAEPETQESPESPGGAEIKDESASEEEKKKEETTEEVPAFEIPEKLKGKNLEEVIKIYTDYERMHSPTVKELEQVREEKAKLLADSAEMAKFVTSLFEKQETGTQPDIPTYADYEASIQNEIQVKGVEKEAALVAGDTAKAIRLIEEINDKKLEIINLREQAKEQYRQEQEKQRALTEKEEKLFSYEVEWFDKNVDSVYAEEHAQDLGQIMKLILKENPVLRETPNYMKTLHDLAVMQKLQSKMKQPPEAYVPPETGNTVSVNTAPPPKAQKSAGRQGEPGRVLTARGKAVLEELGITDPKDIADLDKYRDDKETEKDRLRAGIR